MSFSQSNAFNPAPYDPGAGLNLLTGVRNYQAADAQAQAYAQAIDPQTGQFDQNRYNAALVRQGLTGTWGAGAAMQQAGQATSALGRGTVDQITAARAQLQNLNGILTPLMQGDAPITADQVKARLDAAAAAGAITPSYQRQITNWVASQPPGTDLRSPLNSYQWLVQRAESQLASQTPSYQPQDVGGATLFIGGNPYRADYGRIVQDVPAILKGLSPAEAAQPTELIAPNGQHVTLPLGTAVQVLPGGFRFAPGAQVPPALLPYTLPGGAPGAPGVVGPGNINRTIGTGTYPPSAPVPAPTTGIPITQTPLPPPPPNQPPPQQTTEGPAWLQPPSAGPGGQLGVAPPPGYTEGMTPRWQQSGLQAQALYNANQVTTQQIPLFEDMKIQLGPATVGPGAQAIGTLRGLMIQAGLTPTVSEKEANAQRASEQFAHDAGLLQQTQLAGLGNPTDARQELASVGSPNAKLSKYGNLGMIAMMEGNAYATRAMADGWQQAQNLANPWLPHQYADWQQRFLSVDPATGGRFDPRVFWVANMMPEDQIKYINDLGRGAGGQQFVKNLNYAQAQGWLRQVQAPGSANRMLTIGDRLQQ